MLVHFRYVGTYTVVADVPTYRPGLINKIIDDKIKKMIEHIFFGE